MSTFLAGPRTGSLIRVVRWTVRACPLQIKVSFPTLTIVYSF